MRLPPAYLDYGQIATVAVVSAAVYVMGCDVIDHCHVSQRYRASRETLNVTANVNANVNALQQSVYCSQSTAVVYASR